MATQKLNLTRDQLATFLKNHELIKQFEKLIQIVDEVSPSTDTQGISIQAANADAIANEAIAQLIRLTQDSSTNIGVADGKATQALDLLSTIGQDLEILSTAPVYRAPLVNELADTKVVSVAAGNLFIYDATLRQWRNAFLTAGANVSITNADGSITINVTSATPSGPAGGVLSGSYPNPGFAVDMATQTELDSLSTATATALNGKEPTIAPGTSSQYWRGDKTWQTFGAFVNISYTGTLTGGTGVINIGSGQFYKDAAGNVGLGTTTPTEKLHIAGNIRASGTTRTGGYTVATLPAGAQGMRAYVTDALSPAYLALAVGGGPIVAPVFFNGSNWVTA